MPAWIFMLQWVAMLLLALLSERGLPLWASGLAVGGHVVRRLRWAGRAVAVAVLAMGLVWQIGQGSAAPKAVVVWVVALGFSAPLASLTLSAALSGRAARRTARPNG